VVFGFAANRKLLIGLRRRVERELRDWRWEEGRMAVMGKEDSVSMG